MNRQQRILLWSQKTFGDVALRLPERGARLAEEAIEAAQASGVARDHMERILARVYSRPPGDIVREVGQVGMTLASLAERARCDADLETDREFDRVQMIPQAEWDRRHAAKVAAGIAGVL